MERRLLKDFQIGMVEGIVKDAISTEKEPKDVFSKIARAIGRRTSSQSQKKDWNAMVRRSTIARDPIGSTSEANVRRSRQSLRRYIIENQGEALQSMDPERLLEYNPKLSLVSPAARVAYAKFKMSKIKQEYDTKEATGDGDATSQGEGAKSPSAATGSPSQPPSQPGSQPGSIVRPRPKSSLPQPGSLISSLKKDPTKEAQATSVIVDIEPTAPASPKTGAPPVTPAPAPPPASSTAAPAVVKDSLGKAASLNQDFRARTPIPEEDEDKTPAQTRPPTPAAPTPSGSTDNKEDDELAEMADEKKEEKKTDSPVRHGPTKPGGRSKISGQVLTGWL